MLTQLTGHRKVRRFLVYDLEWIPGTYQLRLIGVYDGREYRSYTSIRSFIENEMVSHNRGKWFYAHFGGGADIQFVLEHLIGRNQYTIEGSFSGSSLIIAHVRRGKNVWHFVDSYWLLRESLAKIGKWIGLEKGASVAAYGKPFDELTEGERKRWYTECSIEELRDYNERDCVLLWQAIDTMENAILQLGGQLQMTLASTAMHLFRRSYLKKDITTANAINRIAKVAYFASRVEVFEREVTDAFYYDVNSSFPYAMTFQAPADACRALSRIPDNAGIYMAEATVTVPDMYLPPLATRHTGRVFFPTGTWRSWFMSTDLELLERVGGRIERVYECILFEPFDDLAAYAKSLYEKRRVSTDDFERVAYKLLLNSLYGKFAESTLKTGLRINPLSTTCPHTPPHPNNACIEMLMPGVFLVEDEVKVEHAHVPISAHITAIARRTLYDYLQGSRPFHYCDTDGFCTKRGDLHTSDELGKIKLERSVGEGYFIGPKLYRIDDKVKAKGFSRMSVDKFLRLRDSEEIEIERMARVKELYRGGQTRPADLLIKKRLRHKLLTKRFQYKDGSTRPWEIGEIQKRGTL